MQFSTPDNDNDNYNGNCAQVYRGRWWYNNGCWYVGGSNLNAHYDGHRKSNDAGMICYPFNENNSLRKSELKFRPIS